jgi:hypothetical protein
MKKIDWEAKLVGLEPYDVAKTILDDLEYYQPFWNGKERPHYTSDVDNFVAALRAYAALHHEELEKS